MTMLHKNPIAGFTIIEVLIGLGILSIVGTGIFQGYGSVLEIVRSAQYNAAALSIIETEVETVRNMRYEDVGVVGGVPAGILAATSSVTFGGTPFTLNSYVRNTDDPADGTVSGIPADPAPADYKLVQFEVVCDTCPRAKVISMASYVAPKNLEATTKTGAMFVSVFDASGIPIPGATVHITNSAVTPPVNTTDVTDSGGLLQLYGVATSSAGYRIVASKTGYSTDRTYSPSEVANPIHPDATVAQQQLTLVSLAIDRLSTLTVRARDRFCGPVPGVDFLLTGSKLVGTGPNVPKYLQSHATDSAGAADVSLEWDAYAVTPTDTAWDIAGTTAPPSWNLDPNTSLGMNWLIAPHSGDGLVVAVTSNTGVPLTGATVRVHTTGYDTTQATGQSSLFQTDWSDGQYDSKSSSMQTDTSLTITTDLLGGSGWLISNTFDLGTSSVTFDTLNWDPPTQIPLTDARFQLAANNDNATWTFVGPDGTSGSFFTSPGQTIPSSLNGKRYIRYQVTLTSSLIAVTPTINDVTISFSSGCLVAGQAYFNGLSAGTYTLDVSLPGYQSYSAPLDIVNPWTLTTVTLSP